MVETFPIGGFLVGSERCFVIAEGGVNHNGQLKLAHELVEAAARAGADCIKFQTFEADQLATESAPKAEYQIAATGNTTSQREMLRKLMLDRSAFFALAEHAADVGIEFLSSPFDEQSADLLAEIGVKAFKLGSGELTNHRLLRHVAAFDRPILVSTGMANLEEVSAAVAVLQETPRTPFALLHCVSAYPALPEWSNLRAMATLRDTFHVPIGWSDHTTGNTISLAAVALGAHIIEKHLTTDRSLEGPDHSASSTPTEFAELVRELRSISASLGNGVKQPVPEELDVAAVARKSLHASRYIPAGSTLRSLDLVPMRPGTGISPARESEFLGRRTARDIRSGQLVTEADVVL